MNRALVKKLSTIALGVILGASTFSVAGAMEPTVQVGPSIGGGLLKRSNYPTQLLSSGFGFNAGATVRGELMENLEVMANVLFGMERFGQANSFTGNTFSHHEMRITTSLVPRFVYDMFAIGAGFSYIAGLSAGDYNNGFKQTDAFLFNYQKRSEIPLVLSVGGRFPVGTQSIGVDINVTIPIFDRTRSYLTAGELEVSYLF